MAKVATWKRAEARMAKLFGTRRRPLSGGNQGEGLRDDGMHDRLHLESKYSSTKDALWRLFLETREKAKSEGRIPVIGHSLRGCKGILITVNSLDFPTILVEWAAANGYEVTPINEDRPKPTKKKLTKRKVHGKSGSTIVPCERTVRAVKKRVV